MRDIRVYIDRECVEQSARAIRNETRLMRTYPPSMSEVYTRLLADLEALERRLLEDKDCPLGMNMTAIEGFLLIGALARLDSMPAFRAEILAAIGKVIKEERERLE